MKPGIGKSIAGGFAGTVVMTMLMYKIGPMMGMARMDIAASLGNMMGVAWAAGMLLHFGNGV
jgi:hypothetical protein